jgi:hypothetical protein
MTHSEKHRAEGSAFYFLAGPFIGLAYVVALPFIGIAAIVSMVGGKVLKGAARLAGKGVSFGWRPAESYLSGKQDSKKETK